jgi:23S rRNA pseudouridine1911/1915/1917 synthase
MEYRHIILPEASGMRVDAALAADAALGLSRSRVQALIAEGMLSLEGAGVCSDAARRVRAGERYTLRIPPVREMALTPKEIPFGVAYEDADLLVVDKPAGLTVHPAAGNTEHTLVHGLLAHCGASLSGIGGAARPGIVHRLDKDTSGLLVVAKHDVAHRALAAQLADRSLSRTYLALAWGRLLPASGRVEAPIGRSPANRKKMAVVERGGKLAATRYSTEMRYATRGDVPHALATLLTCTLETGRTHQIRVHLAHLGHPLVGDSTYGGGRAVARLARYSSTELPEEARAALCGFSRQALHAAAIGFLHPMSGEYIQFSSSPPEDMRLLLAALEQMRD